MVLQVEVDYSSYFSAEGLAQRAAAERQAIKAAARRSLEAEHAILRLLEGTRASAQVSLIFSPLRSNYPVENSVSSLSFDVSHPSLLLSGWPSSCHRV